MSVVTVYAVFADAREAEQIARAMIEEGLAACVNILPECRSIYRWEDRIDTVDEVPALFKTTLILSDSLIARIAERHSYDTPAIVMWPIPSCSPPMATGLKKASVQPDPSGLAIDARVSG